MSGMIALDTNILVHAHISDLPKHEDAKERLKSLAEGNAPWAIPVFCIGEFLRVITHPRLFKNPFTTGEATEAIERLLSSPTIRLILPGERYVPLFLEAINEAEATGNLIFDAQIVALCRESGVETLVSEDRDFAFFPGFKTEKL